VATARRAPAAAARQTMTQRKREEGGKEEAWPYIFSWVGRALSRLYRPLPPGAAFFLAKTFLQRAVPRSFLLLLDHLVKLVWRVNFPPPRRWAAVPAAPRSRKLDLAFPKTTTTTGDYSRMGAARAARGDAGGGKLIHQL
jgi:hypothetical protein